MITQIVAPSALDGSELELTGDEYRHVFRARRTAMGARIRLVDGEGRARWATVASVTRQQATLTLDEEAPSNEPRSPLILAVAQLRKERAVWLVEKACELGVTEVRWMRTDRTEHEYDARALERQGRVARAAVAQCHRARVPLISASRSLDSVLGESSPEDCWYLAPAGGASPREIRNPAAVVLVGPEGGWSPEELERLAASGALGVDLGPRILRVETAAVVGAALARTR